MGFTPAEGLIMGTRCGDLDPGVVTFLQRSEGMDAAQVDELLNKKSGLLGLSGLSGDMREILEAADEGHARAQLALKAYCYRVRKYIGAYIAAMGGVDAVIFTGGVGQGSAMVRALSLQGLQCMGIQLDEDRNRDARGFEEISAITGDDSPVTVLVVPTDEERMIARESLRAVDRAGLDHALEIQPPPPVPLEVSAHHAHLTQEHVEALFGPGHQLTRRSDLSQPGQYACEEQIALVGPKGRIERVRVLGPARKYTQVEISMTEQFKLGIHPPVRESGDLDGTPGCTIEGAAGSVTLDRGVICALRHIHMTPADALRYGVRDKSFVRVRVEGDRELIFGDVLVRVRPGLRARHAHRHRRSQRRQHPRRHAGPHRRNPERPTELMKLPPNKTKIVATIGPASDAPEMLERLIRAGMNVARLNFSHGDFADHADRIARIRAAEKATGCRVAIMADLPGPKMRVGKIEPEPIQLVAGESFTLTSDDIVGDARRVSMSFEPLPRVVKPGDRLFLNDGLIQLIVERVAGNDVHCKVGVGGELRSRKGLNLPGIDLGISAFTDHDRACLEFALAHGVDAVSQSFVETAADIEAVRAAAEALGQTTPSSSPRSNAPMRWTTSTKSCGPPTASWWRAATWAWRCRSNRSR